MYFLYSHTKTTCNKVGRSEDPFYPLPDIAIVDRVYLKSPANTFPIIRLSTTFRCFTPPSLLRIYTELSNDIYHRILHYIRCISIYRTLL